MRQLLLTIFALIFTGCTDSKQQINNIDSADITKNSKEILNKSATDDNKQTAYKIFPIDESKSDSTLVKFIDNLKKIVLQKDTLGLFKSLDTAVVVSHGDGIYGINNFSKNWRLDKPNTSELWKILSRILNMGGTWENDEDNYFCIPYTQSNKAFSKYEYEFDWYSTAVCISPNATVYKEPKITSSKLTTLSYDVVETSPEFTKAGFTKIHTIDKNIQGYVKTAYLMYSADQRLVIKKINNNWKITEFAPFD